MGFNGKDYSYRVGEKYTNTEGYEMEIVEYNGALNCTVKFNDVKSTIVKNREYSKIKLGQVSNPNQPSVFGIGYIGQGSYVSSSKKEYERSHGVWYKMLERCYFEKSQIRNSSYIGCSVDEKWHNFQNFAEWYEKNYIQGFDLDKDILIKGNKVYSPETCCFVPQIINNLFTKREKCRGNLPIGVSFHKLTGKYQTEITPRLEKTHSKLFDTPNEAFNYYKIHKEIRIKKAANEWKPQLTLKTYQALINYQVEITD